MAYSKTDIARNQQVADKGDLFYIQGSGLYNVSGAAINPVDTKSEAEYKAMGINIPTLTPEQSDKFYETLKGRFSGPQTSQGYAVNAYRGIREAIGGPIVKRDPYAQAKAQDIAEGVTPRPIQGSGTYVEDLTKSFMPISQQDYFLKPGETVDQYNARIAGLRAGNTSKAIDPTLANFNQSMVNAPSPSTTPPPPIQSSDALRKKTRQEELDRIKEELEGGATKPTSFSSVAEFDRLRAEKGIVNDEAELQSIQNEARQVQQELRQFSNTGTGELSEAGRIGRQSEAEKNANFRLEGLSIREQGVVARLNSKNAYINTALQMGLADYNQARQEYEFEYNKNVKAIDLYNTELDNQKKDAMASFQTTYNLLKDKKITEISPTLKAQMDSLELQAGLPTGLLEEALTASTKDKMISTVSRDEGIFAIMEDQNGSPYVTKLTGFGNPTGTIPSNLASDPKVQALSNAFNNAVLGLPVATQKVATKTFNSYLSGGDIQGAKNYLTTIATQGLPSDQQAQMVGRASASEALQQIKGLITQAKEKGASTNFFTGTLENAAQKLGVSSNQDLAYIGSAIQQQFLIYRRAMTGVAFSPTESEEYKKIFPSLIDLQNLSTTKIDALTDTFELNNRAALSTYLGGTDNYDAIYGKSTLGLPSGTSSVSTQEDANKVIENIPPQAPSVTSQFNKGVGGIDIFPLLGNVWNWFTGK